MYGHNAWPGQDFAGQKLKFTGHLSDDQLLFAALLTYLLINFSC